MEDLGNITSRSSRRGVAKGEKNKLNKIWPRMGPLEWLLVKQVRPVELKPFVYGTTGFNSLPIN